MQTSRIKIVYVLTAGGIGGAQRYVRDLVSSLSLDRFDTHVLTGGKELRWLSNTISPLLLANDWFAIFEMACAFRREKPDVIHLNSSKAGVVGSFAASLYNSFLRPKGTVRAKVVFTAHGWVFGTTNHPSRLIRACYVFLHRLAAYFHDIIINVSEYDTNLALTYRVAPAKKIVTIPNGIDLALPFLSKRKAREEILSRLGEEIWGGRTNNYWIGSLGRLTKEKDYETLIRAIALVSNVYCAIVGAGPEEKKLKILIEKLRLREHCVIISPKGNDAHVLTAFDLFVLSSIKEGLPYTLLEAGLARVPAIVTDAGGMKEILHTFPSSVVRQRDQQSLAERIKEFMEVPELATKARDALARSVHERYELSRMVHHTEEIYTTLAKTT